MILHHSSPWKRAAVWFLALAVCFPFLGCNRGTNTGPGHRKQALALTPEQELSLGRQAYREVLDRARDDGTLLPPSDSRVKRVRRVGMRIKQAAYIRPLQKEINYAMSNWLYDWNFNVIRSRQVNAFCLPACEVVVFTGLLDICDTDDQLATVIGHEVAHALVHHASERLAREQMFQQAVEAAGAGVLGKMDPATQRKLIGLLGGGMRLFNRSYDRKQESEADHIGLFLMTFARYNPEATIVFWTKMQELADSRAKPPAFLSTHPSDVQRISQLQKWIPFARKALKDYDAGNVVND
jgi:predicted Zn-dependent protease